MNGFAVGVAATFASLLMLWAACSLSINIIVERVAFLSHGRDPENVIEEALQLCVGCFRCMRAIVMVVLVLLSYTVGKYTQ